jgi:hypothetical protein
MYVRIPSFTLLFITLLLFSFFLLKGEGEVVERIEKKGNYTNNSPLKQIKKSIENNKVTDNQPNDPVVLDDIVFTTSSNKSVSVPPIVSIPSASKKEEGSSISISSSSSNSSVSDTSQNVTIPNIKDTAVTDPQPISKLFIDMYYDSFSLYF